MVVQQWFPRGFNPGQDCRAVRYGPPTPLRTRAVLVLITHRVTMFQRIQYWLVKVNHSCVPVPV